MVILHAWGTGVPTASYARLDMVESLAFGWRYQRRGKYHPWSLTLHMAVLELNIRGTISEEALLEAANMADMLEALRCPNCCCTTDITPEGSVCPSCGWQTGFPDNDGDDYPDGYEPEED